MFLLGLAAALKGTFLIVLPLKTADAKKMTEVEFRRTGAVFLGAGILYLGIGLF